MSEETSREVASGNGFYGDPVSANLSRFASWSMMAGLSTV